MYVSGVFSNTHMPSSVHTHTLANTLKYTNTWACIELGQQMHTHTYKYTHVDTHRHTHTHTHPLLFSTTQTHKHTNTHNLKNDKIHTQKDRSEVVRHTHENLDRNTQTHTHTHRHTLTHTHTHTNTQTKQAVKNKGLVLWPLSSTSVL